MINLYLRKPRLTPVLIALLMTLQITACSTEDLVSAAGSVGSGADTGTGADTNNAIIISGVDRATLIEDADSNNENLLVVNGKLNITGGDSGEATFIASTHQGSYGSLTIDTTGNWSYVANNTQSAIQNLSNGETLTDSLTVSTIEGITLGTTHTVVITIMGADDANTSPSPNHPAVISGDDTGSVREDVGALHDNLLERKGKLNISDSDPGESAFIATTIKGNFGSLTIDTAGNWDYAAINSQAVIQNLATGETLTDRLTVRSVDGTTHTVRMTIIGVDEANQPAVISGTNSGSVTEDVDPDGDNLLEVGGKLNITDNDSGEAAFIAKTVNGNFGNLTINTAGNWNYAANNSQNAVQNLASGSTLKDNLTVSSVDGTTHTVKITIIGTDENNQPAVISGVDSASVTEDVDPDGDNLLEAGGKLNITDNDSGEAAFIAKTVNGNFGNLTINTAGNWNYAANNSQNAVQNLASGSTLKDNLTVSSVDGTTHTVKITIIGTDENNQPAVISGDDTSSVTEDVGALHDDLLERKGKLNVSDSDPGESAFIATTTNGNFGSLTIDAAGNWDYAAINSQAVIQNLATGETLMDNLTVRSIDGTTHTVRMTIIGVDETNQPAVISGVDSASVTEDVDPDGDNLLEVGGKLNITDNDSGEAAFIAKTVNGNFGNLTINTAGNWSYAASNSQSAVQNLASGNTLKDNLTVSSVDGTTHTVAITIIGADESSASADINLSWIAPAEREDNSPLSLSEIVGYKIYYGSIQGQYPNEAIINDGSATSYTFTNMPAGTYYFVVTTIDADGRESEYSTEVNVVI